MLNKLYFNNSPAVSSIINIISYPTKEKQNSNPTAQPFKTSAYRINTQIHCIL